MDRFIGFINVPVQVNIFLSYATFLLYDRFVHEKREGLPFYDKKDLAPLFCFAVAFCNNEGAASVPAELGVVVSFQLLSVGSPCISMG